MQSKVVLANNLKSSKLKVRKRFEIDYKSGSADFDIYLCSATEKEVIKILTQVSVTKREQEINLDEQDFGEKKRINKRKKLILQGLDPEEADRQIDAEIEWKRRGVHKHTKRKRSRGDVQASTSSAKGFSDESD